MIVTNDMKRAAMRIVFPPALPFQNPSFRRYPNGSRLESVTFEGEALNMKGQPELLWTVSQPQKGSTYRVNWDWYPKPPKLKLTPALPEATTTSATASSGL
jgi:hypothetical protein